MPKDASTPIPNSRRARRIAERSFWQSVEIRGVGIVLLLLAAANYIQGSHTREEGSQRQRQIDALSQALVSEQQNTLNNGEKPVAPDPKKIIASPDVVIVKGEKGDKGDKGDPGASVTGPSGKNGKDGKDGQDASLPPLDELKGDKGDQGDQGVPGEPGKDGKDGTDGKDGKDGSPPTSITFTINGTTYVCTPVSEGSTSFQCDPQESSTPSPSSTDENGATP